MDTPQELYDEVYKNILTAIDIDNLGSEVTTAAMKNFETFSKCHPQTSDALAPQPTTKWGKAKAAVAAAWDNETTRVLLKAGGAFAGVGLVVYSTIHRDHVIERNALSQANQRSF